MNGDWWVIERPFISFLFAFFHTYFSLRGKWPKIVLQVSSRLLMKLWTVFRFSQIHHSRAQSCQRKFQTQRLWTTNHEEHDVQEFSNFRKLSYFKCWIRSMNFVESWMLHSGNRDVFWSSPSKLSLGIHNLIREFSGLDQVHILDSDSSSVQSELSQRLKLMCHMTFNIQILLTAIRIPWCVWTSLTCQCQG